MAGENEKRPQENDGTISTVGLYRNLVSWIGAGIALISLANILFLMLLDLTGVKSNPYIGILAYMVLPAFLIAGLLLVPLGMLMERRRRRRGDPVSIPQFPVLDLNRTRQRRAVLFSVLFFFLFAVLSAVGSYRAYEYTETVEFCGQLCHAVMHPEFTAYQASPHARVSCVDCHVGPGAGWYVQSKLSGARQVFAAALNTYPRPIPTPVANLRPAQQTCEQCHWPRKFFGAQMKVFPHFASDEQNTRREIRMLLKIGGGDPAHVGEDTGGGIHWHMNIANEITYVATDEKRQEIPWVQVKDLQGRTTVYRAESSEMTEQQIAAAPKRLMDCVDCHNRPSHIYVQPDRAVNTSMTSGRIDASLPFIKLKATTVLAADYTSSQQAIEAIATELNKYYSTEQPAVYAAKRKVVQSAIDEVQRLFRTYRFPEMKVDWRVHDDNIGHYYNKGCFRCHSGNLKDAGGKAISNDCGICHTVLSQSEGGKPVKSTLEGLPFTHPVDIGDLRGMMCSDCHTGGPQ